MNQVYCGTCNGRLRTEAEIARCPDCGDTAARRIDRAPEPVRRQLVFADPRNPWRPRD